VLTAKRSVATRDSEREMGTDGRFVACPENIENRALRVARPRSPGKAFTQRCAVVTKMVAATARSTQPTAGGYLLGGENVIAIPPKTKPSHANPSRAAPAERNPFLTCVIVPGLVTALTPRNGATNRLSAG
jgi:hypothetical protein